MKNEILEFFKKNDGDFQNIIDDSKIVINNKKINDQRSFVLISIIYDFIKEDKIDVLVSSAKAILNETDFIILTSFIKEEGLSVVDYFSLLKFQKEEEYLKLVDFEWKFVGLATLEKFEVGDLNPKILLKLIFNNGTHKILETDYANLAKLQEEIEQNLSSFNSTYSRRIESFSK